VSGGDVVFMHGGAVVELSDVGVMIPEASRPVYSLFDGANEANTGRNVRQTQVLSTIMRGGNVATEVHITGSRCLDVNK
jgi:hypothetical protein